jgi:5-methylcytosine-specific restriction protein B
MVNILEFIKTCNEQTTGLGITTSSTEFRNKYEGEFQNINIKISFGKGRATNIPWISFLGPNQKVQKGIYPVLLFYKELQILILAYGVSQTDVPTIEWPNYKSLTTIEEYFIRNNMPKPEKYGNSFIYSVYNTSTTIDEADIQNAISQLLIEYQEFLNIQYVGVQIMKDTTSKLEILKFNTSLTSTGLNFSNHLISRFVASLTTKPFVILTGLSGSGKTKLAQSFVQWISSQKNQYKIIPVGADWTNREPLLGYPNGLDSNNYVTPDSGALQLIMEASKDENMKKPYFLILDEMNLSHVERYFADFLSIMESKDSIKLYSGDLRTDSTNSIINGEIKWPSNLFIIGTVNIDETTYMFSPKVLDRANVIEFRISEKEMSKFFEVRKEIDMSQLFIDGDELKGGAGQNMAENFIKITQNRKTDTSTGNTKVHVILNKFFVELQKVGAEFGYRSASEIELLIQRLGEISTSMTLNEKIDIAIMQKLLPKLHGSRKKLVSPLETLAGFCLNQKTQAPEIETALKSTTYQKYDLDNDKNANWEVMYPISFEKIQRMRKNVIDNGFTSYAEA